MIQSKLVSNTIIFNIMLFSYFNNYAQLTSKDSVWVSIYTKDSITPKTQKKTTLFYQSLFYKSLLLPKYNKNINDTTIITPIALDYSTLLKQCLLDKTYTTEELKDTALKEVLKDRYALSLYKYIVLLKNWVFFL